MGISCVKEQISLVEEWEILITDLETAEVLNTCFVSIIKNLEIKQYLNFDATINNVKDQTLRFILKCKDHPAFLQFKTNARTESNLLLKK